MAASLAWILLTKWISREAAVSRKGAVMVFPGIFGLVIGVGMIGQWSYSYLSHQIPELEDERLRIWFHIAGEMITALTLIIGGAGLILRFDWARELFLVGMGMLFYSAIVSPGYFAQKGQWVWLGFFGVIMLLGLVSVWMVV